MKLLDEMIKEYNFNVIEKIQKKAKELHISQKEFSQLTGINQSTLSKLLSGKSQFNLNQLVKIACVLDTDISEFVSFKNTMPGFTNSVYSTDFIRESDNFVTTTNRPAFKGYSGNRYYLYFYSTISTENHLIQGELELYSKPENDRCKISLEIYTGKFDVEGHPITKKYTGDMIISISLYSCYCIVTNEEIGEMCFFAFHHMFLFNQNILCRMGSVLTISSGENRRPTLHRMVISKYPFDLKEDSDDLNFLKGQLKLNTSKIILSKDAFEQLKAQQEKKGSSDLISFLEKFEELAAKEEYYLIDEANLLTLSSPVITKIQGISLLREISTANKYNKTSSTVDEFLFKYICETKMTDSLR